MVKTRSNTTRAVTTTRRGRRSTRTTTTANNNNQSPQSSPESRRSLRTRPTEVPGRTRKPLRPRSNRSRIESIPASEVRTVSVTRTNTIKRKPKPKILKPSEECNFCGRDAGDKYVLGEFCKYDHVTAHYFCLLFSAGLTQQGNFEDGIQGFLIEDIEQELRRGKFLKCTYCHKRGALVGCLIPECNANYHFPCGIENGAYNSFHDASHSYPSHCKKHLPTNLPKEIRPPKKEALCTICQESIGPRIRAKLFYTDCCTSYFHHDCLIKLAFHKGLHLCCPNCMDREKFIPLAHRHNIFYPLRYYCGPAMAEVFECTAPNCQCENGRQFNGQYEWELYACDRCGGNATHIRCSALAVDVDFWVCEICRNVR